MSALPAQHMDVPAIPDVWLSTSDAADLLGQSERTVRASIAKYVGRQVAREGSGGIRHEVLLASLPVDAVARWEARQAVATSTPDNQQSDLVIQAYERADQRTRRYFDRWSQALLATESIQGRKALGEWVERWNALHPEHVISVPSLYRVRAQVREQGLVGLLLRESKLPESTVRDEWFTEFKSAYLHENRISAADARRIALGSAIQAGSATSESSFPSEASFLRRLQSEYSPTTIAFARDGEKRYFDRHGYFVERDYSALVGGRIWVGDSRVLDVLVHVEGQVNPVRPWVTLFICMKSYAPMGWHFHWDAPSAENSMRAMRHGIDRIGVPDWLYLDNGREYKNKEFTGVSRGHVVNFDKQHTGSLAAMLGIQVHFAEAKRSRAKPIERQFLEMKNHFDRFWPTFKGGNAVEKPNRLKEVLKRASQIPEFEEVRQGADRFFGEIFPAIPCMGKTHKGRSRSVVLLADLSEHGALRKISADTSAMLVSKMSRGRIGRRGFRISALESSWWAEWMPAWKGREVVLRYDPDNLSVARCYEATATGHGPLIGTCDLIEAAGAMVRPDDVFGRAQVAEQNRIHKHEIRSMRELLPQASAHDLSRMRELYGVGMGAKQVDLPMSNTTILTGHDQASAQVRREERNGRTDLSALVPDLAPTPKSREWVWFDDQAAAAG